MLRSAAKDVTVLNGQQLTKAYTGTQTVRGLNWRTSVSGIASSCDWRSSLPDETLALGPTVCHALAQITVPLLAGVSWSDIGVVSAWCVHVGT